MSVRSLGRSQKPDCSSVTCSHKCILTQAGPSCYCQPGYTLGADKTSCVDVDECQEFGSCSQGCQNTLGSFICSCMEGYVMQNNSCLAVRGVRTPWAASSAPAWRATS